MNSGNKNGQNIVRGIEIIIKKTKQNKINKMCQGKPNSNKQTNKMLNERLIVHNVICYNNNKIAIYIIAVSKPETKNWEKKDDQIQNLYNFFANEKRIAKLLLLYIYVYRLKAIEKLFFSCF